MTVMVCILYVCDGDGVCTVCMWWRSCVYCMYVVAMVCVLYVCGGDGVCTVCMW